MSPYWPIAVVVILGILGGTEGQIKREARWCTINENEFAKCGQLQWAIRERVRRDPTFPPDSPSYSDLPDLECVEGVDRFDCMKKIADNEADLIQLDPGMGYTAGEYFTMMPLVAEKYVKGQGQAGLEFYAVAVVRKDNRDINYNNLQGKKACHPGVGHAAGWVYPISKLISDDVMPVTECNVPTKSAAAFFGPMCAPNGLARFYNPFGNNPATICAMCEGTRGKFCTGNDPFADYHGAFECMASKKGDVTFVRDSTVFQATANSTGDITVNDFELLCVNDRRAPVTDFATCNWGKIPSHTVMTSAIHPTELKTAYKNLLKLLDHDFGVDGQFTDIFELFKSDAWNGRNLMFTDETKAFMDVALVDGGNRDTYYTWVGPEYRSRLELLNTCPLPQARWCVISPHEMTKCENMIMAFAARSLKPSLNCIMGNSHRDCMDKINTGDADLMALDAADVFVAGKYYDLIPIASEDYSGYDNHVYKAVAVARRTDSHLTIFNLKSRRTCHSGVMFAAGWVIPVDKLIETGQIHLTDDNVYRHVGEFFSKSCVPGVLSDYYNTQNTNPINLCEACASGGPDRCMRNDEELYYGNSGAFRCLVERGGDVAFVKHTTARENTDGRNIADWSRNRRSDDYELLCNDGTRRDIDDWENCNMGEIPANAIVTAKFKSEMERGIYWTLLNYAQQFFASDSNTDFAMFQSMLDHKDLIFQDSTVRLVGIEPEKQNYRDYLGSHFVRSMERMERIDRITAGAGSHLHASILLIVVTLLAASRWL